MTTSCVYFKELTAAEVGNTKTHETYIRFPNDFDHEKFFEGLLSSKDNVVEAAFSAYDLTDKDSADPVEFRFVYFQNSNKEKRIPGLGSYFEKRNVEEGDIIRLEKRKEDGAAPKYLIKIYKKGSWILKTSNSALYYEFSGDNNPFDTPVLSDPQEGKPRQVIYYGAPGTGKSYAIKQLTNPDNSVRVTFHPDSDYASFVGAYKPTMVKVPLFIPVGNTLMQPRDEKGQGVTENKIQYEFIPQAFLTAYVEAWRRMAEASDTNAPAKDYYLVIEEINRGHCAQIFGDIFQLLDREKNGYSTYSIKPDKDLQNFLANNPEGFADEKKFPAGSIPENIRKGSQMVLPPNLYIWATMNTSDQSLFPIDSAFKRRWEMVYTPISKGVDKTTGKEHNWVINAGGFYWDWWSFLQKINPLIFSATLSEDKKLGFFFVNPINGIISAKQFVGKVLFYIWNDVFKNFGLDEKEFKDHNASDGENDRLTFDKFFMADGTPKEDSIVMLMENLGVTKVRNNQEISNTDTINEAE